MQADNVSPPETYVLLGSPFARRPVGRVGDRLLHAREQHPLASRTDRSPHGRQRHRMLCGCRIQDRGAELIAARVAELQVGDLLGMRIQQPRVIYHRQKNESLARRQRAARAANNLTAGEPRTRCAERFGRRRPPIALPALALPARTLLAEASALPIWASLARSRREQRADSLIQVLPIIFAHRGI